MKNTSTTEDASVGVGQCVAGGISQMGGWVGGWAGNPPQMLKVLTTIAAAMTIVFFFMRQRWLGNCVQ